MDVEESCYKLRLLIEWEEIRSLELDTATRGKQKKMNIRGLQKKKNLFEGNNSYYYINSTIYFVLKNINIIDS